MRARWDVRQGIATDASPTLGPHGLHGGLVNAPTRAVVGARWSGQERCWRHAPRDYAAIHFHADDLGDCGWAPSFHFDGAARTCRAAPMPSIWLGRGGRGLAALLRAAAARGAATRRVAFLASTFTYQAYANHARGNADEAYQARVRRVGRLSAQPRPCTRSTACSTYNRHPDGSGIALSSRLRPILTMRPGFLTFNDARGSGLRHYPADTHLLAWLEAEGIAFDIVTDEDLDDEGAALLAPYRAVLTGIASGVPHRAHARRADGLPGRRRPPRLSRRQRLLLAHRARSGAPAPDRGAARGGRHPRLGRRAGEYYHQLDGQLGGLWRRNRRPPQALVGVGFSCAGPVRGHALPPPARLARSGAAPGCSRACREIFGETGLSRRRRGRLRAGPRRSRGWARRANAVVLARSGPRAAPSSRCRRSCSPTSRRSPARRRRR